jgi:hypothetical protein
MESLGITEEELYQARLMISRVKMWTSELEKLIRVWRRQICVRQKGHKQSERSYSRKYYILGIPTIILSTLISTGTFATFKECSSHSSASFQTNCPEQWIRLFIGILATISVVLAALMTFLDYGGSTEKHKNAADSYDELVRKIDTILRTQPMLRGDAVATLNEIRTKFDDIAKTGPSLSEKYDVELNYTVLDGVKTIRHDSLLTPPQPDDIPDGDISSDDRKLAHILLDLDEEDDKRNKKIQEANDYDTDEDKPVTIPFDLEAVRPEDVLDDKRVTNSFNRALEFEIKRLNTDEAISPNRYGHLISPRRSFYPTANIGTPRQVSRSHPHRSSYPIQRAKSDSQKVHNIEKNNDTSVLNPPGPDEVLISSSTGLGITKSSSSSFQANTERKTGAGSDENV